MNLEISPLKKSIFETISLPGSKSYTNRALILAVLTADTVTINNPLFSDDTEALINCLKILGVKLTVSKNQIKVLGDISQIKEKKYDLNAHLSGTTIRFILALSCIIPGVKKIYGGDGLNNRPIKELVEGLKQLGANIEYLEKMDYPPLLVKSSSLNQEKIKLRGDISSQYLSAILMIAPVIGNIEIEVAGKQISKPYIDMTLDTMDKFNVKVINQEYKKYIVKGNSRYSANDYLIEGDYSSAGYFFAIAALTKSKITVKNLNPNSKQADIRFLKILEEMGTKFIKGDNQITIIGYGVKPVKINMENFPDQVQTLAVLAAFAKGKTIIDGIKSLRIKETERVKALQEELSKMGIKTSSTQDRLIIEGGAPKSAIIDTYNDHRMAMSFAVAGCKITKMVIKNSEVVSKTFPDFWKILSKFTRVQRI